MNASSFKSPELESIVFAVLLICTLPEKIFGDVVTPVAWISVDLNVVAVEIPIWEYDDANDVIVPIPTFK